MSADAKLGSSGDGITEPQSTRRGFLKVVAASAGVAALPLATWQQSAAAAQLASEPALAVRVTPYRVGRWLPSDEAVLDWWLSDLVKKVDLKPAPLHPVVEELGNLIESDPAIYMYFHQMFGQLPDRPQFDKTPIGTRQVRDYKHMLRLISAILTTAPSFNKTGLVGFPINAILDWPMGTEGGFAAFLNDSVNAQFKKILDAWGTYLRSPSSAYVLRKDPRHGWFGRDARKAMPNFVKEFQCDPARPHHGFTSWDDFFTRRFRPGVRPIASPDDDAVIVSACESAPYRIAKNVKREARFWVKGQPYSLRHMFGDDPAHAEFVGGTIYQAFLSALSYHRWHSPVSGTIVRKYVIDGSYYSATTAMGFDPSSPNMSQGYITEVATRGVMLIQADNPKIGLMAMITVGMAEVSTCDITVSTGQHVDKGEQLGMFHFGGSTHCLIFRPGVSLDFDLRGQTPGLEASNIEVNSVLARVT